MIKKIYKYIFVFLAAALPVCAQEPAKYTAEQINEMLRKGGAERTRAIHYIHSRRMERFIRPSLVYLLSGNEEDQRAIIRSFREYRESLENFIPDWHAIIDNYMSEHVPEDILLDCIELAAFWKEHRLIPALSRLAVHPSTVIRNAVFRLMSRFGNDAVIPVVLRLLNSGRAVERIYGLQAASVIDDARFVPFIMKLLEDSDVTVQVYAVQAAALAAKNEQHQNMVVRLYRPESHPEVREAVIRVIGDYGWRKSAALVLRAVSDADPEVRGASMEAVVRLRELRGAVNISQQLQSETDYSVKMLGLNSLIALERSGGGDGIAYLIRYDPDPRIRTRAVIAARLLNDKSTIRSVLEALYDDPSSAVRLEAAYSLGAMLDRNNAAALIAAISNPKELWEIRAAAMISLISAEGRKNSPELLAVIDHAENLMLRMQWEAVP